MGKKGLFEVTAPAGVEYLGYCDTTNKPELKNKWIKIKGKESKDGKLQMCSGECFSKNSMYNGGESFSATQPKGNGRNINFYSKN